MHVYAADIIIYKVSYTSFPIKIVLTCCFSWGYSIMLIIEKEKKRGGLYKNHLKTYYFFFI